MVEVNCESDFVARTDDFQNLVHDLAMQICATDPRFIRKEDVSADALEREKEILRAQAAESGKPADVVERIVEGRLGKFYEENCLYEQHFIKDQTGNTTIRELIESKIAKLGENVAVRRFARFKVGDGLVKPGE
jgi:elongation factor Ts